MRDTYVDVLILFTSQKDRSFKDRSNATYSSVEDDADEEELQDHEYDLQW